VGPLSTDGSLERLDEAWVKDHRRRHTALFDSSDAVSTAVIGFLLNLEVHNKNGRQLFASCLLARSLQLHLTAVHAIEHGLEAPAKVLLRSMLETVFTLCSIARHPDTLDHYISADHHARLKLLRVVRASKSPEFVLTKAAATDQLQTEFEAAAASALPSLDAEEIARRAGLHHWYDGIYRVLSQATHSTVRDIERYFILNDGGDDIDALRLTPSDRETTGLLRTAGSFLVTALGAAGCIFSVDTEVTSSRFSQYFENGFTVAP
jgi:hypothetical protein